MLPYYVSQLPTASLVGRSAFDGIPVAADRVRLAVDVLSDTIPPGVLSTMNRVWRSLVRRVSSYEQDFTECGTIPGRDLTTADLIARLALLADRAIPRPLPASHLFQLGCAVGEFYQKDQLHDGPVGIPFRPVAEAARAVVTEVGGALVLRPLSMLLDHPDAVTEEGLRNLYIDRGARSWPHPDASPWPNSPFFGQKVRRLHRVIEKYLLRGASSSSVAPASAPNELAEQTVLPAIATSGHAGVDDAAGTPAKPRWDARAGKLWYKDKIAAEFHERAVNVYAILGRFEEAKWEGTINDPNKGAVYNKRYNLKTLNKKTEYIQFVGAGSTLGIRWKER
jgi:hypothetical protein